MQRYSDYENMDDYPELSGALDIYADDATIPHSVRGKTIWGESKDRVVRDVVDDLLHRRLRIEEDIWMLVRTLCKYGSCFGEIVISDVGVIGLNPLPVPTVRKLVSPKGEVLGYVQDLSCSFSIDISDYKNLADLKGKFEEKGLVFFEPWEIVHWKLRSKFIDSLYGWSVIDAARWIWKRLAMLEDTALTYKLLRSPGRYAFYVDTGDMPPQEAMAYVNKVRRRYKKRTLINPTTGQMEFRSNPMSPEDDMWIPTRGGKESTRVEVMSGPDWASMEDIEYFRDKMFTAIKIPKAYYGGEADADQGLAQKDVRFARTCMRVQREFRNGIRHIIRVHMAALNIDPDSVEWDTRMTVPSSIFELQQIEVMNAQAGLIDTLAERFPEEWLLDRVLHMSKEEATDMMELKADENEKKAMESARVESNIAEKYPEAEVGGDENAPRNENVDVVDELGKLNKRVEEAMKTSSMVLQRVKGIEPGVEKSMRKLDCSMQTALRRVK